MGRKGQFRLLGLFLPLFLFSRVAGADRGLFSRRNNFLLAPPNGQLAVPSFANQNAFVTQNGQFAVPSLANQNAFVTQNGQFAVNPIQNGQNFNGSSFGGNDQFVSNQDYTRFFRGQDGAELATLLGLNSGNLGFGQNYGFGQNTYGGQGNGNYGGIPINQFQDPSFNGGGYGTGGNGVNGLGYGQGQLTPWERLLVYGDGIAPQPVGQKTNNSTHNAQNAPQSSDAPSDPTASVRNQSAVEGEPRRAIASTPSGGGQVQAFLEEADYRGSDGRLLHYRAFIPTPEQRSRCESWGTLPFFDGDGEVYLAKDGSNRTHFDWAIAPIALSHCLVPVAIYSPATGSFLEGLKKTWWNITGRNGQPDVDTLAKRADEFLRNKMFSRDWINQKRTVPLGLSGGSTLLASSLLRGLPVAGAVLFCGGVVPSGLPVEGFNTNVPIYLIHGDRDPLSNNGTANDGRTAAAQLSQEGFAARPEIIQGQGHCDYAISGLLDQRLNQILGRSGPG